MRRLNYKEFHNVELAPFEKIHPYLIGGFAKPSSLPDRFRHQKWGQARDKPVSMTMQGADRLDVNADETWVYGGILHTHFGHLISEFLHRLWVLNEPSMNDATVVFLAKGEVSKVFKECMEYFGVKRWLILERPTIVSRIIIAEQGTSIGHKPHPSYERYLGILAEKNGLHEIVTPKAVTVLRGHLPDRRFLGEKQLEEFLERQGYVSFRPEEHSLKYQLATLLQAEKLIISDGSACHLYDLLPSTNVDAVLISRSRALDKRNRDALNTSISIRQKSRKLSVFLDSTHIASPEKDGRQKPRGLRFLSIKNLIHFLQKNGFLSERVNEELDISYYQDFRDYAEMHLRKPGEDSLTDDQLINYLSLYLNEKDKEIEALKRTAVKKSWFRKFVSLKNSTP